MTVKGWAEKWLTTYKKPNVGASTCGDYKTRIDNHILPAIGSMKLKDVKSSHVQELLNDMSGFSRDRLNKMRSTLKQIFEAARMNQLILRNPVEGVNIPKSEDGTRRSISPREREITLLVAKYHYAGMWVLTMLYTGLRPQETAALKGVHIDKENNVIHVEQALKKDGQIAETKTNAGKRDIPMKHFPSALAAFLTSAARKPFGFVFESKEGKPLTNNTMGSMWTSFKRAMQIEAGCKVSQKIFVDGKPEIVVKRIEPQDMHDNAPYTLVRPYPVADDLVPYCYRHTFATDAVTAGVTIETLRDLMGHESINTTAKYYIHATQERLNNAANLMGAYHTGEGS